MIGIIPARTLVDVPIFRGRRWGFTLIEVVIAVGLTAATVLTVFGLLIPARDGAREAALAAAAVRLQPALERDFRERGMEEIFTKVADDKTTLFGLYQVRVLPEFLGSKHASDDLQISAKGSLGDGFSLTTVARDLANPGDVADAESDLDALEGVVFVVRLGSNTGEDLESVSPKGSYANFPSAALVLEPEFIEVPSGVPA